MSKGIRIIILFFLFLILFKTHNFQVEAAIVPGSTCSTKGATTYINGVLYTCTCQIREYNCTWTTTTTVPISTNTPIPTATPNLITTFSCNSWTNIYLNQCNAYDLYINNSSLCNTTSANITINNTMSTATQVRYKYVSDYDAYCNTIDLSSVAYEPRTATKAYTLPSGAGPKKICAEFKNANGQTAKCGAMIVLDESALPLTNTPTPTSILASQTSTPVPTNTPATTSTPAPTNTPVPTITQAPDCALKSKGDANCDEKIDKVDLQIWKCQMNNTSDTSCGAPVQAANFDLLNGVNINDYEIWRRTYQMNLAIGEITPPPTNTPTPLSTNTPFPTKPLTEDPNCHWCGDKCMSYFDSQWLNCDALPTPSDPNATCYTSNNALNPEDVICVSNITPVPTDGHIVVPTKILTPIIETTVIPETVTTCYFCGKECVIYNPKIKVSCPDVMPPVGATCDYNLRTNTCVVTYDGGDTGVVTY